jgi:hypothetical protein
MARRSKADAMMLDRRTLVVWATLVVSLSLVCGLVLVLNPVPHAPAVGRVLTVLDPSPDDLEGLLRVGAEHRTMRWKGIVIHHSGSHHGSADTIGRAHQSQGHHGLGYHFIIGNGDGAYNGEIQAGYRWSRQLDGLHTRDAISICLIGQFDQAEPTREQMKQLVRLVHQLQGRFSIPAERVFLYRDLTQTSSPGLRFPATSFRQQLLEIDSLAQK